MKKTLYSILAASLAMVVIAAIPFSQPKEPEIKGSWKIVKAQYGSGKLEDYSNSSMMIVKMFTGTRWSGTYYDKMKKAFDGSGGGTYVQKGDQYFETLEYYSWDATAIGKTFTFTMTIEEGLLHQKGTIEYKGNPKYLIDEWYTRID